MELSEFDIDYVPRITLKGQVLVDFMLEFTGSLKEPSLKPWHVFVNDLSLGSESGDAYCFE